MPGPTPGGGGLGAPVRGRKRTCVPAIGLQWALFSLFLVKMFLVWLGVCDT